LDHECAKEAVAFAMTAFTITECITKRFVSLGEDYSVFIKSFVVVVISV